jgi:alpha-1,6-mannosyltransferase
MTINPIRLGWLLVSAALFALLGYGLDRTQFTGLLGLYFLVVWGYWIRVRSVPELGSDPDQFYLLAAILFRLLLLAAPTNLSDDYARFIWDGRLLINGYNPYLYLPRTLLGTDIAQAANLTTDLFGRLNSPDYFTVYPPLNQAFFALAAWLGGNSLTTSVIWLRVPILLAEIGTIYLLPRLLRQFNLNPNLALIYALNPLVILELTGNVHFEGVVVFFCVWAVWKISSPSRSAFIFALAVSTKLLPLIVLPLVIRYLGWQKGLFFSAGVMAITVALFLPFASVELIQNMGASINLYFQKFEFNASVYYLVREVGYWLVGYNVIGQAGPLLSLLTVTGVGWLALGRFQMTLSVRLLLTLTLYFAMATTVHPWYITLVVAASVFAPFRYPLVWSAVVWASYATYQREPYTENLWLTATEYGAVLAVGLLERWQYRRRAFFCHSEERGI